MLLNDESFELPFVGEFVSKVLQLGNGQRQCSDMVAGQLLHATRQGRSG